MPYEKRPGDILPGANTPPRPDSCPVLGTIGSYCNLVACYETDRCMPSHGCSTLSNPLLRMCPYTASPLFSAQLTLSHVKSATSKTSKLYDLFAHDFSVFQRSLSTSARIPFTFQTQSGELVATKGPTNTRYSLKLTDAVCAFLRRR